MSPRRRCDELLVAEVLDDLDIGLEARPIRRAGPS